MADFDPQSANGVSVNPEHAPAPDEVRRPLPADGGPTAAHTSPTPDPAAQATNGPPDDRSGLDRAEEVVDYVAERVSALTSDWGRKFLRLGSRARESAQDFWAEVQDFRQGKKP
jgi:hypothetical protein